MISYRTGSQNSSAYGRIIIAVPFINFNDSIAAALVEAPRRTLNTDEFAKSVSLGNVDNDSDRAFGKVMGVSA